MDIEIHYTQLNSANKLNKEFDTEGKKKSNGMMLKGTYQKKTVNGVEELFKSFDELLPNQAIALGIPKQESGQITTMKHPKENAITRTKDNFRFAQNSFLLIDYDPSNNGFEIKSPKHLVEVLRDIDPKLKYCDIGVRYGSSCGIYKDGIPISNKKSLHAYFVITNASDEKVKEYRDFLVSEAWAKGYGHIELSKTGSILKRQVFDSSVFTAERLIFEAKPTLAKGLERIVAKHEIFKGEK